MPTFSLGITGEKWWGDLCGLGSLFLFCVTQHLSMPLSKYSAAPLEMLKATGITKLNQIKCVQQVFPSPDGLAIKFRQTPLLHQWSEHSQM